MTNPIEVIKLHVPNLLASDEQLIYEAAADPESDAADYAIRTCRCGVHIPGYYHYVDHLIKVLGGESHFGA